MIRLKNTVVLCFNFENFVPKLAWNCFYWAQYNRSEIVQQQTTVRVYTMSASKWCLYPRNISALSLWKNMLCNRKAEYPNLCLIAQILTQILIAVPPVMLQICQIRNFFTLLPVVLILRIRIQRTWYYSIDFIFKSKCTFNILITSHVIVWHCSFLYYLIIIYCNSIKLNC